MSSFTTPETMRGTWYFKSEYGMIKLAIFENEIIHVDPNGLGRRMVLYKKISSIPDNVEQYELEQWYNASYVNVRGMQYIHVLGRNQTSGSGVYYAIHTEEINGNKVPIIIESSGEDVWTGVVYYPSEDLANQQGDTKYEDLHYR